MTPQELRQKLDENRAVVLDALAKAKTAEELAQLKNSLVGKTSAISELRSVVGDMEKEQRPEAGQILNEAYEDVSGLYDNRLKELIAEQNLNQQKDEVQDLSAVISATKSFSQSIKAGRLHPITQMQWRLEDVFCAMGYTVVEGPEVESEWNNFGALNFPLGHPARDMYDTFYVDHGEPQSTLLRTHTSPVQVRTMLSQPPPIYVVAPGRCYRQDTADSTHMPVFHQIEGLVVDKGIQFGDLAGTIDKFIKAIFGNEFKTRLRPSYFPFTEPSAEFDIFVPETETNNKNAGKWIEMGGCGMVHPNVFEACGINPSEYTGFAFGFGIDRLAMMEFGIDDLREFWNGDIRFLRQF